jgi:hypothetical protein
MHHRRIMICSPTFMVRVWKVMTSQYGNNRTIQKEVYDSVDSSNEDRWVLFMLPAQVGQLMKNAFKLKSRCQHIRDNCKMTADETAYEMNVSHWSRKYKNDVSSKYYKGRSKVLDIRDKCIESRAITKKNRICKTSLWSFRKMYSQIVFNVFHVF